MYASSKKMHFTKFKVYCRLSLIAYKFNTFSLTIWKLCFYIAQTNVVTDRMIWLYITNWWSQLYAKYTLHVYQWLKGVFLDLPKRCCNRFKLKLRLGSCYFLFLFYATLPSQLWTGLILLLIHITYYTMYYYQINTHINKIN